MREPRRISSPEASARALLRFFLRGLRCFARTKVLGEIGQHRVAIRVVDNGSQAFHLLEFSRPLLPRQVLLRNAARVVALRAGSFHFGLHGTGWKRLTRGARCLRGGCNVRKNEGCE